MATHDYIIDNQSASAFRSDLNGALQAIVTQNSNATAPTTTYANMIWYDTAANQLKKRNEANSAWITLGTIDEVTGTFLPNAIASQAQAEAGTSNTLLMTPLRTAQNAAIFGGGLTRLGSLSTATGSSVTLSSLNLTNFKMLEFHLRDVDNSTTSNLVLNGTTVFGLPPLLPGLTGFLKLDLSDGSTTGIIVDNIDTNRRSVATTTVTTATTSLTFSVSSGTFDGGSIVVFGEK